MATNPTAQFWCRTDGHDSLCGGGYDSGYAGGTTGYCDQASAQVTFTATLSLSSGTLTDSGAGFLPAHTGYAVQITGQGYYWISAYLTSSTVTVVAATGTTATSFSGATGYLGGAFLHMWNLGSANGGSLTPSNVTPLVAGNKVNVRASGSGAVGSPDYAQNTWVIYPAGDTTNGRIFWIGYNGQPVIEGARMIFYQMSWLHLENIYFYATGNADGTMFYDFGNEVYVNCVLDLNSLTSMSNTAALGTVFIGCEMKNGSGSSSYGVAVNGRDVTIKNCKIHANGYGIVGGANCGVDIQNCAVYLNTSGGMFINSGPDYDSCVSGCTIDANTGDGLNIPLAASTSYITILNNNITNNSGYGINVAAGTATANTANIGYEDYNNVYNNTSGQYHNLNGGAHDINVNPGYANASAGQFTPSNTALIAAAPIGFA